MPTTPLHQLPRWRSLPREMQLAVLSYTDVATAARFQDALAMRTRLPLDLPGASDTETSSWWIAVLETGWLEGAKMLLDAYVPRLPLVTDNRRWTPRKHTDVTIEQVQRWPVSADIVTLYLEYARAVAFRCPDDDLVTLFHLANCVSRRRPETFPLLREVWNKVWNNATTRLEVRNAFVVSLVEHGNIAAMKRLNIATECFVDRDVAIAESMQGQQSSVAVLSWLREHHHAAFDASKLLQTAIWRKNLTAVQWLLPQIALSAEDKVRNVQLVIESGSLEIAQWLYDHVGILCCETCQPPPHVDSDAALSCSGDRLYVLTVSLSMLQWLRDRLPCLLSKVQMESADPLLDVKDSALFNDVVRLVHDLPWFKPKELLMAALSRGCVWAAQHLVERYPQALHTLSATRIRSAVLSNASQGNIEFLEWVARQEIPDAWSGVAVKPYTDRMFRSDWMPMPTCAWFVEHPGYVPWTESRHALLGFLDRQHELHENKCGERSTRARINARNNGWGPCPDFCPRRLLSVHDASPNLPEVWASRAFYDFLAPTRNTAPGLYTYFMHSAAASKDYDWILQVERDYEHDPGDLIDCRLLYRVSAWPVLHRLLDAGLIPLQGTFEHSLHLNAFKTTAMLLRHYKVSVTRRVRQAIAVSADIGLLQLVHSLQLVCLDCVVSWNSHLQMVGPNNSKAKSISHVALWASRQQKGTWTPCKLHK
ncbi:hypothetical protein RI367_002707 [Sorochytrium milnesiophthora]